MADKLIHVGCHFVSGNHAQKASEHVTQSFDENIGLTSNQNGKFAGVKGFNDNVSVKLYFDDDIRNEVDHGPQNLGVVIFLKNDQTYGQHFLNDGAQVNRS